MHSLDALLRLLIEENNVTKEENNVTNIVLY